ncbi:MAG: ornithine carbamoyltransferase [Actinobacteria bacterium]|nr:ornithine carbamoyltransferase [Actinomycetota bacterium]
MEESVTSIEHARASFGRHFLDMEDLNTKELMEVLALSASSSLPRVLEGRGVAVLMAKPSNRTRNSTEMAVVSLGGHPLSMSNDEVGVDTRESAEDIARTLACYHSVIAARVGNHDVLQRMAAALDRASARVSVVNLLSDHSHPCQALADVLTLRDFLGGLEGRSIAYVGDANNVCRSLTAACSMMGMRVRIASPPGYGLGSQEVAHLNGLGGSVEQFHDPQEAVEGVEAIYTDVWISMGQEAEREERLRAFTGFTVDTTLLQHAAEGALVMHCLPAHRGEEITDEVLESPNSKVWVQAANRMRAMRGLLAFLALASNSIE